MNPETTSTDNLYFVYCDEAIFYIIMEILVCTPIIITRQDGITHTHSPFCFSFF